MFVFILCLVSHEVCIHMQYFFGVVEINTKYQNQKKIKSSRKEYFM